MSLLTSRRSSGDIIADRRHAYSVSYAEAGDVVAAAELMAQAMEIAPGWASGWLALGEFREAAGDRAGAADAYRRAMDHDAEDVAGAAARLARLGLGPQEHALSRAHVTALFDDYAPRFEASLVGKLDYRAPAMLRTALAACRTPLSFRRAIDLGCGTGLVAEAVGDVCDRIEGVDLSAGMLAVAARKGLYARLTRAELLDYLTVEPAAGADLVLAADVLIYIGDPSPLFRAASRALTPGGLFALTIQMHASDIIDRSRYALGRDLRYAHDPADVGALAAASRLVVLRLAEASIRSEAGRPVPGAVVVLEKPGP